MKILYVNKERDKRNYSYLAILTNRSFLKQLEFRNK